MQRPEPDLQAKLAGIRLILMDIDGTLVSANKPEFLNVLQQLGRVRSLGVQYSLATGRTIAGATSVAERLWAGGKDRPPMITYNGAVLVMANRSGSKLAHRLTIPADRLNDLLTYCRIRGLRPLAYTCHQELPGEPAEEVYSENDVATVSEFNGMATTRIDDLQVLGREVVAVLIEQDSPDAAAELATEMALELPRLRVTTSGGRYVEVCHPEGTKLDAMRRLADALACTTETVMAVGDNLNDIDMIRGAGVGVCVGNAPAEVQKAADYRCERHGAEGVVEALRMLVRAQRNARRLSATS